jgi:hypothetical protein
MMPATPSSATAMPEIPFLMEAIALAAVESYHTAGMSADASADEASLLCKVSGVAAAAAAAAVHQAVLNSIVYAASLFIHCHFTD